MKFTPREALLGVATAAVALFGGTYFLLVMPELTELNKIRTARSEARKEIERDKPLVQQSAEWKAKLAEVSARLPTHPADKKVDVYWLSVMDSLASKNDVKIIRRQVRPEERSGDLYELPIECREFEGSLDAVVHFLFDLQEEGAMLDIRQLSVKPKEDGTLRGQFTLYCAYTRESQPAAAGH